jgi:hypothetical protein
MTKSRSFTYLLPGLTDEVKINKSELENLWLGVENINTTFDGNVYCEYVKNCSNYDTESAYYVTDYTIDDKKFVCYQYPYPDIYNNFVSSQYSKFPTTYKNRILTYHGLSSSSLQHSILFKSQSLKTKIENDLKVKLPNDCELGEQILFENESYNIKNL